MRPELAAASRIAVVERCVRDGELYHDLKLNLASADSAAPAQPGQFFMLSPGAQAEGASDPLLLRPLSVLDSGHDHLRFLFKAVGRGTSALARLRPGDEIRMLGPLGNSFSREAEPTPLLVGGGVGIPPLVFLSRRLSEAGIVHRSIFGFGRASDVPRALLADLIQAAEICTLDGSEGFAGNPVEVLSGDLQRAPVRIQACGPRALLDALAACRRPGDELELSLEERMACGLGICRGCVVPVSDDEAASGWRYETVCREGPVFAADRLHDGPLDAPAPPISSVKEGGCAYQTDGRGEARPAGNDEEGRDD